VLLWGSCTNSSWPFRRDREQLPMKRSNAPSQAWSNRPSIASSSKTSRSPWVWGALSSPGQWVGRTSAQPSRDYRTSSWSNLRWHRSFCLMMLRPMPRLRLICWLPFNRPRGLVTDRSYRRINNSWKNGSRKVSRIGVQTRGQEQTISPASNTLKTAK
jgi:hypothetical protein